MAYFTDDKAEDINEKFDFIVEETEDVNKMVEFTNRIIEKMSRH